MPTASETESVVVPASFAQRRLWLLDQLDPGSVAYHIAWVLHLDGAVDRGALSVALNQVVARHEALRTEFGAADGQPVQAVAPPRPMELPYLDLSRSDLSGSDLAGRADAPHRSAELLTQLTEAPFDLAHGPLLRATLVRLAPDRFQLLLVLHHIVVDGWSCEVMVDELSRCYAAAVAGGAAELPELPIQYADFSQWQHEQMQQGEWASHLAYWREALAGAPTLLELPTDRPRPSTQSYRGAWLPVPCDAALVQGVKALARESGTTPFAVLLAAFGSLLFRYSAAADLLIGTPVSGRTRPETSGLVGLLVNTLALRCRLEGGHTFRQVLAQAARSAIEALEHQETPFEHVVELLQPERSLAYNPVVQVLLSMTPLPDEVVRGGLRWRSELVDGDTTKFDLHLAIYPTKEGDGLGGWDGRLYYATDLYDETTARALVAALLTLLRGVLRDPDAPIAAVGLLSGVDRQRALATGVPPSRLVAEPIDVGAAVARWSHERGEAVAVVGHEERLTYRELATRASRLAHLLRTRGVGPDTPVGVYLDRGAGLVVAVLAIWQAGGVYLPLDPSFPADRLRLMLADAHVEVVVTQASARDRLAALLETTAQVVSLDDLAAPDDLVALDDLAALAAQPGTPPPSQAQPAHMAYILYTSGSTGRPKGVACTRAAVGHLLASFASLLDLSTQDRWLAVTTPSFDIGLLELTLPLVAGAQVVVADQSETADARALRDRLVAAQITVLQATPVTWRLLSLAGGVPAHVRIRISGGEPIPSDLVDVLVSDGAEAWNGYGPTETTVYSAIGRVRQAPARIGGPVGDTRLYVVDGRGEPVPPAVVGEVYLGGPGVARGYLNRPDLTAERFVADPFGPPGARLYRTGDLGRWGGDATLDFVGRADRQVKIRGFRVELGEIEAQLRRQSGVRAAAVAVAGGGDDRLVAYLVPDDPAATAAQLWPSLRSHLARQLPDYMVPATVMLLAALPTTPSGKLDRAALPAPDWTALRAVAHQPPRTPIEESLAKIWSDLLAVPNLSVHDNFFALGGHSLTATRLIARIHTTLGLDLPLRALFSAPTIAELAEVLTADGTRLATAERIPTDSGLMTGSDLAGSDLMAGSDLIADLDRLTDTEIDQLLTRLINEDGELRA